MNQPPLWLSQVHLLTLFTLSCARPLLSGKGKGTTAEAIPPQGNRISWVAISAIDPLKR